MSTNDDTTDTIARILERAEELGAYYAHFSRGDDARARRAATDSIEAIDAMLARLHRVRSTIVTEARRFDDATNERADALLAARRVTPASAEPTLQQGGEGR